MIRFLFFTSILLLLVNARSQELPLDRFVDWSDAGLFASLPETINNIDFDAVGGINDGVSTNSPLINSLITTYGTEPTQINFGTGAYFFDEGINLPSNFILNGVGANFTQLLFDLGGATQDLIKVSGAASAISVEITESLTKGDSLVIITSSTDFEVGDWVQLLDNDSTKITSPWAIGKTGQIVQIEAIAGTNVSLKQGLRRDYDLLDNPRMIKLDMKQGVGIQNLGVKRLDETLGQTCNINFRYANNCFVHCVESELTNFAHVKLEYASNCEVTGSYFFDAFDYGNGGKAYGVVAQFATGNCLVSNNNFNRLRHAMLLQAGANGNVYSYNYSTAPYWSGVGLPKNAAGDLVLHGNYVYANLFEGNVVQNVVIDDSHGENGPFNTFFRNRVQYYGFFMNNSPASDRQNFIGNEITNPALLLGFYFFEGEDHFFYCNNHKGTLKPEGTEDLLVESLYLNSVPTFYTFYENWPPIGYPNEPNEFDNEAKYNRQLGYETQCEGGTDQLAIDNNLHPTEIVLKPNPSAHFVEVTLGNNESFESITILELNGKPVLHKVVNKDTIRIDLFDLEDGIYIVAVKVKGQIFYQRLVKT